MRLGYWERLALLRICDDPGLPTVFAWGSPHGWMVDRLEKLGLIFWENHRVSHEGWYPTETGQAYANGWRAGQEYEMVEAARIGGGE